MIKILFFIDTLSAGGAEKVLQTLVNNMDRQKFDITVHTLEAADPRGVLADGVRYRAINRCKTPWGKKLFSYWLRLCAELKWIYPLYIKGDYDIEVAYLECGPTKFLSGSSNKKALKLAWVHCDLAKRDTTESQRKKWARQYDAYDKVICVSDTAKESFIREIETRTEAAVLYNVNDEAEIRRKAGAFSVERMEVPTISAVGRLSYEKGCDRLLEACRLLKNDGLAFHLQLIGEGPERGNLERLVRDYGMERQVTMLGFQSNPYPYMAASDLIAVPSRYEGLSTVVTEALILGKPVVTTPCSGMGELLGDSEYGLITDDSVEGLYLGMKQMLASPALREHYAWAAKKRSRQFEKAAILAQTEAFFLSELEKKQRNR